VLQATHGRRADGGGRSLPQTAHGWPGAPIGH